MEIIVITHPAFMHSQSMPRYASWIVDGMRERGHDVEVWAAKPRLSGLPLPGPAKKWAGYADQYLIFSFLLFLKTLRSKQAALFVYTDHSLGPLIPFAKNRPHAIHCHDFLAQLSALGKIRRHRTGRFGKIYQSLIRKGFRTGRNFIATSTNTESDLAQFLEGRKFWSKVIYNGLTQHFEPVADASALRKQLRIAAGTDLSEGFLLHVGGNQWYKNRPGVIDLYDAWRKETQRPLPLVLIGQAPDTKLGHAIAASPFSLDIKTLTGLADHEVRQFYGAATLLLFPSFAEGFGWPIIEAMASGCPVITTGRAPMTEVGGDAAFYLADPDRVTETQWKLSGAEIIERVTAMDQAARAKRQADGYLNVRRFRSADRLDEIEEAYKFILEKTRITN